MLDGNHDAAVGGARLDVLAGNAHPDLVDVDVGLVGGFADGATDGLGGIGDALHHAMLNAFGVGFSKTQDFHFAIFGTHAHETGNLGGANVKTYNDFVSHKMCYF
jgi:hypothetical protein